MKLETLEALAKSATPGPWRRACHGVVIADKGTGNTDDDYIVMWDDIPNYVETDATFIAAANPKAILELIALVRLQHEAFESLYAGTNTQEWDSKALELFDSALAAFDKFNSGETK